MSDAGIELERNPRAFAVRLGMDALRLAIGRKPKSFTPFMIVGFLTRAAEKAQPIQFDQCILDAHAQFGGDLRSMQRAYDMGGYHEGHNVS